MRGALLKFLDGVRASFWFVPTVMTVAAILLSVLTLWGDQQGTIEWLGDVSFVYLNQPDGARSLLSTIAGSVINVAGVVFSLTMVTLTLASQQFGPRLLGNFMRDRGNQFVLGVFISTFLYCLLILRAVRSEGDQIDPFVPHLSVTVAMLLTLVTLGALIYFIHYVASSIQVQHVISKVIGGLRRHVAPDGDRDLFPAHVGDGLVGREQLDNLAGPGRPVTSRDAGYLQTIDGKALMHATREHDAVVRLRLRPGEFVMHGAHVMDVYPPDLPEAAVDDLLGTLSLGAGRGQSDDVEATFDQLLELALRALSPSMNDPITAAACVDRIADGLLEVGRGHLPSPYRADEEGVLRIIVPPFEPHVLARRLFASLRSGLAGSLLAAEHSLKRLAELGRLTDDEGMATVAAEERAALLEAARGAMSGVDYETLLQMAGPRMAGPDMTGRP